MPNGDERRYIMINAMKIIQRSIVLGVIVILAFAISPIFCEKVSAAGDEKYPKSPITVIVSWAAGGGTDIGARMLMPLVEKELGVPVVVVNKPGAGGWVGWSELLNTKTDGYTIAYINTPGLMAGYLNPATKNNSSLNDFDLIANHVIDFCAIGIRPGDNRFKDIKELMEYAKKNEVTGCSTGVANDEHILMLRLNKMFGTKFVPVHTKGAGEGKAIVLGGHIDVYVGNVGDITTAHKEKELKIIAVAASERSKLVPDVPTFEESGYKGVYGWASRGLAAKKGIPKDRLEILINAFEKAINNPEHQKKMDEMGLFIKFLKGKDYDKLLHDDEDQVKSVFDLLGWTKK
jgi:tripartite-type tricarboxylate transporter receptor subunit TctC